MEILYLLLVSIASCSAANLPRNWKACRVSDKQRGKCLKEAAQIAYDFMVKGEKSLGIPSLDPMKESSLTITDRGTGKGPMTIKFILPNYTLTGFKSGRIDDFKLDCSTLKANIDVTMKDDISITGHYNGTGKVLLIPVYGKGDFKFVFEGYKLHGEIFMSEGNDKKTLKLDKFMLHIQMSHAHVRFDNLFDGNKLLGDNMNTVFNENWNALFEELSPSLDREFARVLAKHIKSVVERIPRNALCPD